MAKLNLINISKKFQKRVLAVDNISLEVNDGEFVVFLGPSGCGKTTALRMIAGLEEVTKGRVLIDDEDVTHLPPRKRDVSMVFQNYAVWPHMNVYDNIAYPLRLKKMGSKDIDRAVREVAALTDIGEYLQRYPGQLSGGQKQRVAVARAIAVKPRIFLMDEPLSNLDAKLRVAMRTELKSIHEKTRATTIFVTHDQSEALSLADRIVVMRAGQIVQIGTPEEVYNRSANMFVADFIGTPPTNFLKVEVQSGKGGLNLHHQNFNLILSPDKGALLAGYLDREVYLGIRPENITVSRSEGLFKTGCLLTEPQGSFRVVVIRPAEKIIKISVPAEMKINSGEEFWIGFKADKYLFFDPETEELIS